MWDQGNEHVSVEFAVSFFDHGRKVSTVNSLHHMTQLDWTPVFLSLLFTSSGSSLTSHE